MGRLMIIIRDGLSSKGRRKKSATCSKREQSGSAVVVKGLSTVNVSRTIKVA